MVYNDIYSWVHDWQEDKDNNHTQTYLLTTDDADQKKTPAPKSFADTLLCWIDELSDLAASMIRYNGDGEVI